MPSRSFYILSAAVLVWFFYLTRQRNEVWRDPVKLWSDAAMKSPKKPRPWINLGRAERVAGTDGLALAVFRDTIRRFPENPGITVYSQVEIAAIRMHRGELTWAQGELERILVRQNDMPLPDAYAAYNNLAFIYAINGRPAEALQLLDTLISLDPAWQVNASANFNRGMAFRALKNCDEALGAFRMAHRLDHAVEVPSCP